MSLGEVVDVRKAAAAVPGLVRIAASSWLNTAEWSFVTSWRITRRLMEASRDPDSAAELARELGVGVATITELARKVAAGVPLQTAVVEVSDQLSPVVTSTAETIHGEDDLRAKGEALLRRSRDVWDEDDTHPAYSRILDELSPDEARMLVLLAEKGPQPSVDVRAGARGQRLVAQGLTMVGARAGLRHVDKVPAYLHNLHRLGLVWFAREALGDNDPYQVLEAQPDVLAAIKSVSFPKVVRRAIHLTPFGRDFVAATLREEPTDAPEHALPPGSD